MKAVLVLSVLFCATFPSLIEGGSQWLQFKARHAKTYGTIEEEQLRFASFKQNLKTIEEHNLRFEAGQETYQMGINQYADWSNEEYLNLLRHQSKTRPQFKSGLEKSLDGQVPDSIDWRDVGAVSPVKTQGICGSCWAFSVTGTLESFYFLKTKEMVTLSEQQLVDCDTSNQGCNGGEEAPALEYIKNHGIEKEDSYPYEGETLTCRYNDSDVFTKVADYVVIKPGDEDTLLSAVGLLGPVSVALDASGLPFFQRGVFTSTTCSQNVSNHAVLAVGYGFDETSGLNYWLIKNSWGESWGEQGYFKIRRGTNECGIAIDNVYPVL